MNQNIARLNFSKGLLPTVVVDRTTGKILMVGFSSSESLELTWKTGFAHFFSRSRQKIWKKGEESGNTLKVFQIYTDCDFDSLIFVVEPAGPTCHTSKDSCFFRKIENIENGEIKVLESNDLLRTSPPWGILSEIEDALTYRKLNPKSNSFSSEMFQKGLGAILGKLIEEIGEFCESAIEGKKGREGEKNSLVWESADLIFMILLTLRYFDISIEEILKELKRRREEKLKNQ